jgi:hypothetical protein
MMSTKPMDFELNANIEPLVDALNDLPGIETIASCGGDAKETEPGRAASKEGEFYVAFYVDILWGGWSSLEWITQRAKDHQEIHGTGLGDLEVRTWIREMGDFGELAFSVGGRNGVDPKEFAKLIAEPWDSPTTAKSLRMQEKLVSKKPRGKAQ